MELKIKHCKNCQHLTPLKGNILGIKKIKKIKTRNDLINVLGNDIKITCHMCGAEEFYIDKDIIATNKEVNQFYGICGLIFGFLSLIGFGVYQGKTISNLDIQIGFLSSGLLIGTVVGLVLDKIRVKKFNNS